MIRLYKRKCRLCEQDFKAKATNKLLCPECENREDYISFWLKNTCNMCGISTNKRDQNGRGYDCGCHDKHMKEFNSRINRIEVAKNRKGPGECIICKVWNEKRDIISRGINCGCSIKGYQDKTKQKGEGLCSICKIWNKERDQNARGLSHCTCSKDYHKKMISNRRKPGNCSVCGLYTNKRDEMGRGYTCGCHDNYFKSLQGPGECCICKKFVEHRSSNTIGIDCGCASKIITGFNREEFYKGKFNIISFQSLEEINIDLETNLQTFDSLKGKIGVWSRWTDENHGNYCLDVCKTVDIGSEMLSSLRSFNNLKENPNQELDIGWKRKYFKQAEDAGLFNNRNPGKIIFKLVALCETEEEALKIEQQYAHDNKSKYWSPQPGQKIIGDE